jgi:hypothetical protein
LSRIGVIVKGWPRLSETFVAQELVGLEEKDLDFDLWSLRHPTDKKIHALAKRLKAQVRYLPLPEYLWREPARVLRGWWKARRLPGYRAAFAQFLRDWRRDATPNRGRRFFQACVLAAEADPAIAHFYAHFIHTPGSVARYAAMIRGASWSAFAHAKDIWTTPDWEKREKLNSMVWCARKARLDGLVRHLHQSRGRTSRRVGAGQNALRAPRAGRHALARTAVARRAQSRHHRLGRANGAQEGL